MKIKRLGQTGLKVSEICLGTMTFGIQANEATAFQIMDVADQNGVTFFDTADMYPLGADPDEIGQTEVIVGKWLRERKARERIVLATKCGGATGPTANDRGASRKHIIAACDQSLRRLQTDYIDLYQIHFPDPETPIEETMDALDTLVRSGKVRYLGCSNYAAWQLADAHAVSQLQGLARFESVQPRYNILFRMIEEELIPLCQAHNVGIIVYNPLAGGMLTGRYRASKTVQEGTRFNLKNSGELYRRRYWKDAAFEAVDQLNSFFEPRGKGLVHVALSWVLAQPGITSAIVGASKPEQLSESLKALEVSLNDEELQTCNELWYQLPREQDATIARR
ncbi:aldo/keto reductase [Dictyobacter arantiisoli]|nr:aldo/keto reductase [Dictyobacter arantiisoli]